MLKTTTLNLTDMLAKIALTALIVLGFSGLGAGIASAKLDLNPYSDNRVTEIIYNILKYVAIISVLVLIGCLITCVWTAEFD